MSEDTGGGAHVGGNASAGRNLIGRDSSSNSDYNHGQKIDIKLGDGQHASQHDRESQSLHKRVQDMERYLYGDHRAGEPGLIMRVRTQLRWSQVNTVLLAVILLTLVSMLRG